MFRRLPTLKDTYITDKIIRGSRSGSYGANVGQAGTLDLFKIYGNVYSGSQPLNELSRILIKFDLTDLTSLVGAGAIDITHSSFSCKIKLFDIASGNPTPDNFTLLVAPLSKSWDEGIGRDVVSFKHMDTANWLTASYTNGTVLSWSQAGAAATGALGGDVDVIMTNGATQLWTTQSFADGDEDLYIDVTAAISSTLSNQIQDNGFRISYLASQETDDKTRFVKRFASRHVNEARLRPRLHVLFDDHIIDNKNNFYINSSGSLFLYNHIGSSFTNLVSGSSLTQITGQNSVILKLLTEISGGWHTLYYTGSQLQIGTNWQTGIYKTSFAIPSTDSVIRNKMLQSGSVQFTQVWGSLDGTVGYMTGTFTLKNSPASTANPVGAKYYINCTNVMSEYRNDQVVRLRFFIFDPAANLPASNNPIESTSLVFSNAHYRIRDIITDSYIVEEDYSYNPTQLSADSSGMYCDVDMASLDSGRTYCLDIVVKDGLNTIVYRNVTTAFKVHEIT